MPTETEIGTGKSRNSTATSRRSRSATASASRSPTPASTSANSSPPSRTAASSSRVQARSRSAKRRRTSSPAGWPSVSLTRLKWSRSQMTSASGPRRPSSPCSKPRRLRRPVSGSSSARSRICSSCAGGLDRADGVVGEGAQRAQVVDPRQQQVDRVVGPQEAEQRAGAVAQRHHQPVVVPRVRAAAVVARGVDDRHARLGGQRARRLGVEQHAALLDELGRDHALDGGGREAAEALDEVEAHAGGAAAAARRPPRRGRRRPARSRARRGSPRRRRAASRARERLEVRSDETRSRCSTAARWRAASAASWACSITLATIAATADRTSSAASHGRRPSTGSSSERKASRRPSDAVSGTSSASSGCQASGPSPATLPVTHVMSRLSKSNWSCGTRKAPWRRKRSSSSLSSSAGRDPLAEQRLPRLLVLVLGDHDLVVVPGGRYMFTTTAA